MIIVGLTGSIGMGKSTTAALFAGFGDLVHDADDAVHRLYSPAGSAVEAVATLFPGVVRDGAVDRRRLAARVLGDAAAMASLEAAVHPLVREAEAAFLAAARAQGARFAVLDIPLLFETRRERTVDAVVVVTAPAEVQRARVALRPGMTEESFAAILGRQMPDADKRRRAHFVISTGDGLDRARMQVAAVRRALSGMAR